MQTIDQINNQTIKSHATTLSKLAEWYVTTAAAETLEAGRIGGPIARDRHARAAAMSQTAAWLAAEAAALGKHLEKRDEINAPTISRMIGPDTAVFINLQNSAPVRIK